MKVTRQVLDLACVALAGDQIVSRFSALMTCRRIAQPPRTRPDLQGMLMQQSTTPRTSSAVRFGAFELDRDSGELRKHGVRLKLDGQPLELLKQLLERKGEIVTREELKHRLWPADTFVDFEHSINAVVKRLRHALGDSAEAPRFIETLPRRGYRFICPLSP